MSVDRERVDAFQTSIISQLEAREREIDAATELTVRQKWAVKYGVYSDVILQAVKSFVEKTGDYNAVVSEEFGNNLESELAGLIAALTFFQGMHSRLLAEYRQEQPGQ